VGNSAKEPETIRAFSSIDIFLSNLTGCEKQILAI